MALGEASAEGVMVFASVMGLMLRPVTLQYGVRSRNGVEQRR
jgi:hypothetical protein